MTLTVNQISKKYGSQQVLDAVSFSVDRGEIVGFLGPNGAGKTTTMKIITGCIRPDSGLIGIENQDMQKEPLKAKRMIGYLPEDNPLYDEMYVSEYLEYVAKIYSVENTRKKVGEVLMQTGLLPEVQKKIGQLSKGYRQRVGLAQAIIHQPKLLVLDEPASGLDPNQIDEINSLIRDMSKEKAILFSSHTLSEVQAICTRIIIIHKGKIMFDAAVDEIEDLPKKFRELTIGN